MNSNCVVLRQVCLLLGLNGRSVPPTIEDGTVNRMSPLGPGLAAPEIFRQCPCTDLLGKLAATAPKFVAICFLVSN